MSEAYLDCAVEVKPVETTEADDVNLRRDERVDVDGVMTAVRQAGFCRPDPPRILKVLDVSAGGVSFESPRPMPTGQKVEMSIDTPTRYGIKAIGRVKYCIRWASNFRIGVEFVDISPTDQRSLTQLYF
ncbi:MAG TPA: PilZ domain-containing protein [Planctomycetota bacterium]|nr:PilZ domain-containing protein [Planctomycetota bacterium]